MTITAITQVTRINPQNLWAVPVSAANRGSILSLLDQLFEHGYTYTNQNVPDGWRLVISQRNGAADQVVYFGDLILVVDATYASGEWTVSRSTQVSCYGVSTELAGTVADFNSTFQAVE